MPTRAATAQGLSHQAQMLWGKSGAQDSDLWLPLYVHLRDAAEVAAILWDRWVPPGAKLAIINGFLDMPANISEQQKEEYARNLFILEGANVKNSVALFCLPRTCGGVPLCSV